MASIVASTLFAFAGMAQLPPVASGFTWWTDVSTPHGCRGVYLQAIVADHGSYVNESGIVELRECFPNGARLTLPAGWIGVDVGGWRDGGFCGSSDWFFTTNQTGSNGRFGAFCADPDGVQSFQTDVGALIWNGANYSFVGWQFSPSIQS